MAKHEEVGDPAAEALERIDEALSQAVDQLALYLDMNHPPDERSAPADLLAAVLHRYANRQHPNGGLSLASLSDTINEVLEAWEESDWLRGIDREKYGQSAGDLLSSLRDTARPVAPRLQDRREADDAVSLYCDRVDRHLGESAGLPAKQKVPRNAQDRDLYGLAIQEAMMLYHRFPERFVVNLSTAEINKESVFDVVATKYNLNPKTLFNHYNSQISKEMRARLSARAREKRRTR